MTTAADDRAVEDAFEAYLAGRPVPEEGADLASFAGAVRATATRSGRPNSALAELLATGLLTDQPSPSARTARSAGSPPPRGPRIRNRRRFAMILPALIAKLLSAGAVAQAATGAGVALVVVTGAGAAGVLPDPLQNTVAAAVETVTPLELPEGGEGEPVEEPTIEEPVAEEPVADEPATDEPATDEGAEEVPAGETAFSAEAWATQGPDAYSSFGAWVSAGAEHDMAEVLGVRFGELVSARARDKGMDAADLEAEGVDLAALGLDGADLEDPADETTAPAPEVAAESPAAGATAPTQRGGGRGNAGKPADGQGSGNADRSGNGSGNAKGNGRN
ncbi:hypothetical protein FHU33_4371 [Blastococcus colisei]|uniref:Uncharacterized protein n=1 Tax=Blastococcus colisei TaxID=1564162 RepID=A0A543P0S5_9ACTN|nr:hypothetical protein [Blastococcus colisei]TQN37707.1 hypothetical protein FHU33_4371 [Blastococcus colisei]